MSKLYVIQWKSKINGRAGKGAKLFEQHEAEQLAQELNQEYPDIHHELAEADSPGTSANLPENQTSAEPASEKPHEPPQVLAVDFNHRH